MTSEFIVFLCFFLLYLSKETKQAQQAEHRAELRGLEPPALGRGVVVVLVLILAVEFVDILVVELPVAAHGLELLILILLALARRPGRLPARDAACRVTAPGAQSRRPGCSGSGLQEKSGAGGCNSLVTG